MISPHQIGSLAVAILGLFLLSFALLMLPMSIGFFASFSGDELGFSPVYLSMLASCASWLVAGSSLLVWRSRIAAWLLDVPEQHADLASFSGARVAVGLLGTYLAILGVSGLIESGVHLFASDSTDRITSASADMTQLLFGLFLAFRSESVLRIWRAPGTRTA